MSKPLTRIPESRAGDDDYDPHEHRVIERPTTNMETLIHVVKCSLGTGILAIPQAFTRAGLITGIVGTVIVGIMLTHCLQLLIKMQYKVCKIQRVPQVTYPQALESSIKYGPRFLHGLAKPFGFSVDIFNITYQLGVCCVYIVFLSENIKKIMDSVIVIPLIVYMLIIALPLIGLNLIPSLKALAPLSLVANAITFIGLAIITFVLLTGSSHAPGDPIDYWGHPSEMPLFFGTMLFALTAVPVVVALERSMKTPKAYTAFFGVLNIGMTFIVILYAVIGAIGYVYCRSACSDSITLDMPSGAAAIAVQITMILAILISYALHCYVPVEVIFRNYVLPKLQKNNASRSKIVMVEYVIRVGLALFTLVLAMLVPRLGLFISLFGALCLAALGMCFPTIMEICLSYPDNYGPAKIYLVKDIVLCFFGLFGLVAGTVSAFMAIIRSFF